VVVDALDQWNSRFEMHLKHLSEQGSRFKDKPIKEFNHLQRIDHRLTTAYSPWANGAVEIVINDIQKFLSSLSSKRELLSFQWLLLLPVSMICSSENHDRSGCPPLKIMTGLDVCNTLSTVLITSLTRSSLQMGEDPQESWGRLASQEVSDWSLWVFSRRLRLSWRNHRCQEILLRAW